MANAFVYMLRCADGSYYVGSHRGDDLAVRIAQHQTGHFGPNGYTYSRRPVQLVWSDWFDRFDEAIVTERRIKGWSRVKKEALIRGDWAALKVAAKRRGGASPHPEVRAQRASKDGARGPSFEGPPAPLEARGMCNLEDEG